MSLRPNRGAGMTGLRNGLREFTTRARRRGTCRVVVRFCVSQSRESIRGSGPALLSEPIRISLVAYSCCVVRIASGAVECSIWRIAQLGMNPVCIVRAAMRLAAWTCTRNGPIGPGANKLQVARTLFSQPTTPWAFMRDSSTTAMPVARESRRRCRREFIGTWNCARRRGKPVREIGLKGIDKVLA